MNEETVLNAEELVRAIRQATEHLNTVMAQARKQNIESRVHVEEDWVIDGYRPKSIRLVVELAKRL